MSHNQLLSREDVINAYKFILGRAPESEQVIDEHRGYRTVDELRLAFLTSSEFGTRFHYLVGSCLEDTGTNRDHCFAGYIAVWRGRRATLGGFPRFRRTSLRKTRRQLRRCFQNWRSSSICKRLQWTRIPG